MYFSIQIKCDSSPNVSALANPQLRLFQQAQCVVWWMKAWTPELLANTTKAHTTFYLFLFRFPSIKSKILVANIIMRNKNRNLIYNAYPFIGNVQTEAQSLLSELFEEYSYIRYKLNFMSSQVSYYSEFLLLF